MSKMQSCYAKLAGFTPAAMADAEPSSVIAERARANGMPYVTGHHVAWARKTGFIRRVPFANTYYAGTWHG